MTNITPDLNGFDSEQRSMIMARRADCPIDFTGMNADQRAEIIAHRPDCPIHFDGHVAWRGPSESKATTSKESWWAGYRAGKGLPANTPRQDAIAAPAECEKLHEDAARWRHARKLLTVDDIEGARRFSEDECARVDAAIDAVREARK